MPIKHPIQKNHSPSITIVTCWNDEFTAHINISALALNQQSRHTENAVSCSLITTNIQPYDVQLGISSPVICSEQKRHPLNGNLPLQVTTVPKASHTETAEHRCPGLVEADSNASSNSKASNHTFIPLKKLRRCTQLLKKIQMCSGNIALIRRKLPHNCRHHRLRMANEFQTHVQDNAAKVPVYHQMHEAKLAMIMYMVGCKASINTSSRVLAHIRT